jgi:hypothetical protein
MERNDLAKNLFESALTFTRFGLSMAGTAVGYAAEVLKDVEHELKQASGRMQPPAGCACGCAEAPAADPRPPADPQ